MIENASVRDNGVVDLCPIDLRGGQEARPCENGRAHVKEVKPRQFLSEIEVRLEKRADCADILPVTLKDVGEDARFLDSVGDDVLAEIRVGILEQLHQHLPV